MASQDRNLGIFKKTYPELSPTEQLFSDLKIPVNKKHSHNLMCPNSAGKYTRKQNAEIT